MLRLCPSCGAIIETGDTKGYYFSVKQHDVGIRTGSEHITVTPYFLVAFTRKTPAKATVKGKNSSGSPGLGYYNAEGPDILVAGMNLT